MDGYFKVDLLVVVVVRAGGVLAEVRRNAGDLEGWMWNE